jgi:hypothetical protein
MRSRFRLSHATVVAYAALFVALGGTATAVTYVVSSNSQIGPGTISGHQPPTGKHANIIANSINGTDIADRSGVETCQSPLVKKFGPICAGSDAGARTWGAALDYCTNFGLRLPTTSEAVALAKKFDVPGVGGTVQAFWTDDEVTFSDNPSARVVKEDGTNFFSGEINTNTNQTVCVTDPSA